MEFSAVLGLLVVLFTNNRSPSLSIVLCSMISVTHGHLGPEVDDPHSDVLSEGH